MSKKVEQQQVVKTPQGYFIATTLVTLEKSQVTHTEILSLDSRPFPTKQEADTFFEENYEPV